MNKKANGSDEPPTLEASIRFRVSTRQKLCPRCLKPLKPASSISGWLVPEEYVCESCGYQGHLAIEPSVEFYHKE